MDTGRRVLTFLCILLLLILSKAYSETLTELVENNDVILRWDPIRESGEMVCKGKHLQFNPSETFGIVDGRRILHIGEMKTANGKISLSDKASEVFASFIQDAEMESEHTPRIAAILIDPGHGGKDPGTVGRHTFNGKSEVIYEKDIVLQVSKVLSNDLKKTYPHKKIFLTRTEDTYPTLKERVQMANNIDLKENEAIIFLSIHVNATANPKSNARGYEAWYLPPEVRRKVLDEKEIEQHKEIAPIMNSMLEEEYTMESVMLARKILAGMDAQVGEKTKNRGLKAEKWYVVRKAMMPAVLIELGFITNKEEAYLLTRNSYLNKLSQGIYNGVCNFVDYFENTKGFTE